MTTFGIIKYFTAYKNFMYFSGEANETVGYINGCVCLCNDESDNLALVGRLFPLETSIRFLNECLAEHDYSKTSRENHNLIVHEIS